MPDRGRIALQRQAAATERAGAIAQGIARVAQRQGIHAVCKGRHVGISGGGGFCLDACIRRDRCGCCRVIALLESLDHTARLQRRRGCGCRRNPAQAEQRQDHRNGQAVTRQSCVIAACNSQRTGMPLRPIMSTPLTTVIQLNLLHCRITPHWSGMKKPTTTHVRSRGPPEVFSERTRPSSATGRPCKSVNRKRWIYPRKTA